MPGGAARPAESCFAVSSTLGGNLQIEAALSNIGLVRWWRSFAAWSFWRGDSCWGWWPSSLPLARWEDPGQYGPIVWTSMAVQEPGQARAPQPTAASFVRGTLWLEPTTRAQEAASGWLLDLAGRRVMQLYGGWNDIGALAPGVYYIRLETSGVHISRKVILTGND